MVPEQVGGFGCGMELQRLTDRFRRAKIKLLAKKSIETGEDCDAIPESMRTYLANQALESGKPLSREFLGRSPSQMSTYGSGGMLLNPDSTQPGKIGRLKACSSRIDNSLTGLQSSTTSLASL